MDGIAEQLSNGHHPPEPLGQGDSAPPTEAEVQEIIQSIRDASAPSATSTHTSPPTPALTLESDLDEGAYWDLSSMAPLNTRSRVSINEPST